MAILPEDRRLQATTLRGNRERSRAQRRALMVMTPVRRRWNSFQTARLPTTSAATIAAKTTILSTNARMNRATMPAGDHSR